MSGLHFDHLPRTDDGIVCGVWRALHSTAGYTGELGPVFFRDGRSDSPLAGRLLVRLAGALGNDVTFEPWLEPYPSDFVVPEVAQHIPANVLARFTARPVSPSGEAEAAADITPSNAATSVSPDDEPVKRRRR